MNYQCVGY